MRSRYSAFVRGDSAYLLRSWHSSTRPRRLDLDDSLEWTRLDVLGTTGGVLFEDEGTVLFSARYVTKGRQRVLRENSRFLREGGQWRYVGPVAE